MKLEKIVIIKIVVVIVAMIVLAIVYSNIIQVEQAITQEEINEEKTNALFDTIEKETYAYIDKYTIYGNHLNIGGYISNLIIGENFTLNNVSLVLRDLDLNETSYELEFNIESENIIFELSKNINEGIDLDKLTEGNYFVFLKITLSENENTDEKYYSIKNITDYTGNEYYTMTKNNANLKIDITFPNYNKDDINLDYMNIVAEDTNLPSDVYDIVIDPGHGGSDPGAIYDDNFESEYTLEYSIELKNKLEELGYKVKLTREEDEYIESYGEDGRAVIPNEVKSKLFISIHLNSTVEDNPQGGVEVYASNNANLEFAKNIADNIVNLVGTTYSPNNQHKVLDGVYVRTYSESEIEDAIEYANDLGYEPYESLSTETPYLFVIRETGGIMTHAYVDGRNTNLDSNPYYDSNISTEAYLLELGFINSINDIEHLKNDKEAYINAIVEAMVNHYI